MSWATAEGALEVCEGDGPRRHGEVGKAAPAVCGADREGRDGQPSMKQRAHARGRARNWRPRENEGPRGSGGLGNGEEAGEGRTIMKILAEQKTTDTGDKNMSKQRT